MKLPRMFYSEDEFNNQLQEITNQQELKRLQAKSTS